MRDATVLDELARDAARALACTAASVALVDQDHDHLRIRGAWGLSVRYRRRLERRVGISHDPGPTARAVSQYRRVMVPDIQADPVLAPWHAPAASAGYRSLVATPLGLAGDVLGALIAYRSEPGPWPAADMDLLTAFADRATAAIVTAYVLDRQGDQLARLAGAVRDLREQTHEQANQLHSIGVLLTLGEVAEAHRFISRLLRDRERASDAALARIERPALAGVLLAELELAAREGITLELDRDSSLAAVLPRGLDEAEAVAIVGHLLQRAYAAVAAVEPARRHVTFAVRGGPAGVVLAAVDRGDRLPPPADSALREAVHAAGGRLTRRRGRAGNVTVVRIAPVAPP